MNGGDSGDCQKRPLAGGDVCAENEPPKCLRSYPPEHVARTYLGSGVDPVSLRYLPMNHTHHTQVTQPRHCSEYGRSAAS